ncbi:hypothetical protein PAXRUDRAFT_825999 [Paxillus rubicundulus Ve08.2h10]|uniref:DUF605-domain-containing protein n=1 Tax=Paxillus rubicundulus Ve08.2h10 TaxID=930991 RepID=A0A0D0E504_9AGAM|nr:hypothetical protein PAXRUDRAFT_825999 [Paxillus rubicundulus Ve08.2h10]
MSLGLPPVSTGLKTIAPYLQRAEELVASEPVIAYWSAYYAAQVGISLKAQDPSSRNLLLNLLDALERLKKEIGTNDAIDMEPASAAYVENFALKVFKMADDEDRAGKATKSTAKKFLASANFFEVLRVFPKAEVSESTEPKLKYAKWKAADIAKAFREGRRPTPGPPGSQLDPEIIPTTIHLSSLDPSTSDIQPSAIHQPSHREPSPATRTSSSRSPKRQSPPPSISPEDIARANRLPIRPGEGKYDDATLSPGRWSTTATPGLDLERTPGLDHAGNVGGSWQGDIVDPLMMAAARTSGNKLRTAWVSTEMENATSDEEPVRDPVLNAESSRGRVRFSPACESIIPIEAVPPLLPHIPTSPSPPRFSPPRSSPRSSPPRSSPPRSSPSVALSNLPPGFVPTAQPRQMPGSEMPSSSSAPSFFTPPPPPLVLSRPVVPPPSAPTFVTPFAPASASALEAVRVTAHSPPRAVELTPSIIAKAQRHCRFAISSLDYEDPEHAIKELRAALEILGG